jgi:uncharacterized protein YfaT (DUF1175 family)
VAQSLKVEEKEMGEERLLVACRECTEEGKKKRVRESLESEDFERWRSWVNRVETSILVDDPNRSGTRRLQVERELSQPLNEIARGG